MFDQDRAASASRRDWGSAILRSRTARLATAVGATLALGASALAAQASAATIVANRACYVNDDPAVGALMTVTGTGFVPGDSVELSGTDVADQSVAQPNGSVVFTTQAPILATIDPASETTTLTAQDFTSSGATISAQTTVQSANLAVSTTPSEVKNLHKDKVRFRFSGFVPGRQIYGFYARKRVVAKTKFGKAKGACGMLTKRALLFPGGHPHKFKYTVTFESLKKYSKTANPRLTADLNIFKL